MRMVEENNFESDLDDIVNALNDDVDKSELKKKLEEYLSYGVPLDQAKNTLIKQYGGTLIVSQKKNLKDVQVNERGLNLICRVISINPKEIEVKGEKRKIFYGFLGDETATRTFTSWKDFEINKGDVIQITNAYSREWRKEPQINLSESTDITQLDPSTIESVARSPSIEKIIDLRGGMGNVEVTARLLSLEEKTVTARGKEKKIYSGILGDTTGKIPYTSWKDFGLNENDIITVTHGYVKSWRGAPQLVFDENSQVEKLDSDRIPLHDIGTVLVSISDLIERGGGVDVMVKGTVLEVIKDSGLIYRCPDCNRVLRNGMCGIHGEVQGVPDLRIKAILDDGTGSLNALFNRELTEQILGMTLDECKKTAEEAMNYTLIEQKIINRIIAHPFQATGDAFSDEFGLTFLVHTVDMLSVNIQKEAHELLKELDK
jgi:replication factor A1